MAKTRTPIIVVDGGEGSGTTTMSTKLTESLRAQNVPVVHTREPGGTNAPFAETIRELILSSAAKAASAETMFGLFWASRHEHLLRTILPALQAGRAVIIDRFDSSTYAYQVMAQECPGLEKLFWDTRKLYLGEVEALVHYVVLDVDPKIGVARAKQRGGIPTHFDERKLDFHRRVREGYKAFLNKNRAPSWVVDASKPEHEVFGECLGIVRGIIQGKL